MSNFARSRFFAFAFLLFALLQIGCGGETKVTVTGKVTSDDGPLAVGSVTFHPDASKGNTSTEMPSVEVDASGNYTLEASAGAYKVTVFAEKPRAEEGEDAYAEPEYLVSQKFNAVDSTPLAVDVTAGASPGAYDLKVSSQD